MAFSYFTTVDDIGETRGASTRYGAELVQRVKTGLPLRPVGRLEYIPQGEDAPTWEVKPIDENIPRTRSGGYQQSSFSLGQLENYVYIFLELSYLPPICLLGVGPGGIG